MSRASAPRWTDPPRADATCRKGDHSSVALMRTAIDCFAGAGGATQGLRNAGFDVVAAVEIESDAAATWRANHPGTMLQGDIRDVDPVALRALIPPGERLSLLKACPPCQGFSSLRGASIDESRNDLVLDTLRLVDTLKPVAVLVENVPGLRRDQRFEGLLAGLRVRDYRAAFYTVEAGELGVPQRRRRLVVIAVDGAVCAAPPSTLTELIPSESRRPPMTAGQALRVLNEALDPGDTWHRWRKSGRTVQERIAAVPVGGNRLDLPEVHRLACHASLERNALASYGRVKSAEVAPTMTTRCTTPACGSFIHPTEDRGLSIREAAAFQTFPADYVWIGGYDSVERQIGNAVPVWMAEELGRAVVRLLDR